MQTTFNSYQTEYEMNEAVITLVSVWMYLNWIARADDETLKTVGQLTEIVKLNGDDHNRNIRPVIIAAQDYQSRRWSGVAQTMREAGAL